MFPSLLATLLLQFLLGSTTTTTHWVVLSTTKEDSPKGNLTEVVDKSITRRDLLDQKQNARSYVRGVLS